MATQNPVTVGRLPSGGMQLLQSRLLGHEPDGMVVVSLIGYLPTWAIVHQHLLVQAGREYDWRFLAGLTVCVVVSPGLFGVAPTLLEIAKVIRPGKLICWDETMRCGCDVMALPTLVSIDKPQEKWNWQLDVLPWLDCENREFEA